MIRFKFKTAINKFDGFLLNKRMKLSGKGKIHAMINCFKPPRKKYEWSLPLTVTIEMTSWTCTLITQSKYTVNEKVMPFFNFH